MHSFSTNSNRVKTYSAIAVLSVLVAMAVNWLTGFLNISNSWLISAPTLGAVYTGLYFLVDKVAWRWPVLRMVGLIDDIPISGKYEGEVYSDYDKKKHPVKVDIDQTWTKILVRFEATKDKTSESCSISASCENVGNGNVRLNYTFRNKPNPGIADDDMKMHEGTTDLLIKKNGKANGRYFNDRPRAGTILLKRKS